MLKETIKSHFPWLLKPYRLLNKIYKIFSGFECYDPRKYALHDFGKYGLYDFRKYSLYDNTNKIAISKEHEIYDPDIYGLYDYKTQRVLAKIENSLPGFNLDIITRETKRFCQQTPFSLGSDPYTLVLQYLIPGEGILLDACTTLPKEPTKLSVEQFGYRYLPIDINTYGETVKREDLTKLSFADNSIAAIISVDTLEHIDNYTEALAELYRVLKEDGLVVIHVPAYYFDRPDSQSIDAEKDPWEHVRFFSAVELLKNIHAAGFIIIRIAYQFDYGAVICVASKNSLITADR